MVKIVDKRLYEGERIPIGWGVAWYDRSAAQAILLPWGINWLVGVVRVVFWRVANGFRPLDGKSRDILYRTGKRDGYADGFKAGLARPIGLSEALDVVERFWHPQERD